MNVSGPHTPLISEAPVKSPTTVVGLMDDVLLPPGSTKTDWEVELGVVVGRRATYLRDEGKAAECIAGYVISNDVSERHYKLERGGQWVKGKSLETFNPSGLASSRRTRWEARRASECTAA